MDQLEQTVGWWNSALLKRKVRNGLTKLSNPVEAGVIELPESGEKGAWTEKHAERLQKATMVLKECDEVASTIETMKSKAIRNQYRLEVYEQVNELVRFSAQALLALQACDIAQNEQDEAEALNQLQQLPEEFSTLRDQLEQVYGETRILTKPQDYILDQDHHRHLANQSRSFDWLFVAELLFLEKVEKGILNR